MKKISMKEAVSRLPMINFYAVGMDVGSMELRGCVYERSVVRKQKSGMPTRIRHLLTVMNIKLQH
jgi:hypothetical protein